MNALVTVVALAASWPNSSLPPVTRSDRGEHNVTTVPPQRTRVTRVIEQDIVKRYQAGQSTRRIAASLDIAKATVLRVLKSAGVPMRPTGTHY
jgi:DNA-binding NarL/FixJ family response regulator